MALARLNTLLTINSGSSSLKATLFLPDGERRNFNYRHDGENALAAAFDSLFAEVAAFPPDAIGHRFVHGGESSQSAAILSDEEMERLRMAIHLAPLHLPGNLLGAHLCRERFRAPQVACFDTAFHHTLPEHARRLPIPEETGIRRYGFHGLNYAHIASVLPEILGENSNGRIVCAHLGSGASLCLLLNLRSVYTSMGHTPAGGIPMGTRSGDLDPGVMLELGKRFDPVALSDLVYRKMGLHALSGGISSEMSVLLASDSPRAAFAVDYFCREAGAAIGAYAARAGGIDALVFSGGIGENSPFVREKIVSHLSFLGLEIDPESNRANGVSCERPGSKPILVVPADEEAMIRKLTLACLQISTTSAGSNA